MNNQKRLIDASKGGWNDVRRGTNTSSARTQPNQQQVRTVQEQPQRVSYAPKQVSRQPTQQVQHNPPYTVGVNPHANIIYQDTPQPLHQQQVPIPSPVTHKAQPVNKEQKPNIFGHDPEMKNFDITGCKSIDDIYNKNAHRIKIIPE